MISKSNKKYKLVLFDVDGTLLDTSEGIISSVKFALKKNNLALEDGFDYTYFIGPPVQTSFKKLFPHLSEEEIKKVSLDFRNQYKDVDLLKAIPYPGLYETLDSLRDNGIAIAVATYKREDYALSIMQHFKITDYTDIVIGQDFDGKRSKKDIVELAIEQSGFDKKDCLMVGDTNSDGDAASMAEVDFLGVTFGFGFSKEKGYSGPSIGHINSFIELLNIVSK